MDLNSFKPRKEIELLPISIAKNEGKTWPNTNKALGNFRIIIEEKKQHSFLTQH